MSRQYKYSAYDAEENITNIAWPVYGKIDALAKNIDKNLTNINYSYAASGNRVSKKVGSFSDSGNINTNRTWYVKDAQGNAMATYENYSSNYITFLLEQNLYGSSRLGKFNPKTEETIITRLKLAWNTANKKE